MSEKEKGPDNAPEEELDQEMASGSEDAEADPSADADAQADDSGEAEAQADEPAEAEAEADEPAEAEAEADEPAEAEAEADEPAEAEPLPPVAARGDGGGPRGFEAPPKDGPLFGVLAEYDSPGALVEAAKEVRDAGYTRWDCYSPFPVHGLDPAMGIKRTILPWIVFGGGLAGLLGGIGLQWWTNGFHWPWIVSGKPFFSIPANIPITFETTVLLSGLTCFFAMWTLNKLPKPWHPFFRNDRFTRVTDDGFFIGIEAEDPKFDHDRTAALLDGAGAVAVEDCHIDPDPAKKKIPRPIMAFIVISTMLALVPFALIAKARASKSDKPHWHIIPDMDFQPKAKAQTESDFFEDGRSMRMPVEGTVARGELRADDHFYKGTVLEAQQVETTNALGETVVTTKMVPRWADTFPDNDKFRVDAEHMKRGQERFNIYCSPCHGESGNGQGMVATRAREVPTSGWNAPTDVNAAALQPHGQIFNTITHGIRQMPAYGPQIPPEDRWAIVLYVRALQRSQNATMEDVPPADRSKVRQ
jgi:mono/diheme cytochrome c family protein